MKEKVTMGGVWASLIFFSLSALPGCVATRDWVREQISPLAGRVSDGEKRIAESAGNIENVGRRLSGVEGQLIQADEKADRALNKLANLRLEKRLVLDLKEGANFAFDSARLTADARKEIDGFLSDLKAEEKNGGENVYLIAGHADGTGPSDYNYELGKKRAANVERYLITQKKIDPMRVIAVSYGKENPLAENSTREGRAKNRRVEILIYRENIRGPEEGPAPITDASHLGPSTERTNSHAIAPYEQR